jgi:hypothetical protein
MKLKILAAISFVALTSAVHAQQMNGSLGVVTFGGGSYSSSSLSLGTGPDYVTEPSGDLSVVPNLSNVDFYTGTLSGLSSTATAEDVQNYLQFSSTGGLNPDGTTPPDRFTFTLTSLTEEDPVNGNFLGSGILFDTTGAFSPTAAEFALGFSSSSNYSFTFSTIAAAPEPSSWALAAILGGAFAFLRFRRSIRLS